MKNLVGSTGYLVWVLLVLEFVPSLAFQSNTIFLKYNTLMRTCPSKDRRIFALTSFGSMFGGLFGGEYSSRASISSSSEPNRKQFISKGPTNEIVTVIDGIKQRRLGGSDIIVSELGLGTQRWYVNSLNFIFIFNYTGAFSAA